MSRDRLPAFLAVCVAGVLAAGCDTPAPSGAVSPKAASPKADSDSDVGTNAAVQHSIDNTFFQPTTPSTPPPIK